MDRRTLEAKRATRVLARRDPRLGAVIRRVGPFPLKPLPGAQRFASLVEAIVYQQLSGKAAATIFGRFRGIYGDAFPTAEDVLTTPPAALRAAGLSQQKCRYLLDLCRHVEDATLRLDRMGRLPDDRIVADLTRVKGVGVWTAQMFLIFTLGRLDVLPTGDLGIQKAVGKLYGDGALASPRDVAARGEGWRPYRSVASWYLWASLDIPTLGLAAPPAPLPPDRT